MATNRPWRNNLYWHTLTTDRRWSTRPRLAAGLVALLLLALLPRTTQAVPSRTLMVLNISEAGHPQEPLRAHVSEFLKHTGVKVVDTPRLPAVKRSCEESKCLNQVAEEHRAQLILGARVVRHSARDRIIYMWLYDSRDGGDHSEQSVCDVRDLEDRLHELAGKLVGPYLQEGEPAARPSTDQGAAAAAESSPQGVAAQAASAPPAPPLAPAPEPEPVPTAQPASRPAAAAAVLVSPPPALAKHALRARWRTRLAFGLGVLSAGALAAAIALQSQGGTDAGIGCPGSSGRCVYDYMPLFAPMYAAAGALAVGTVLTLTLPSKKEVH